MLRVSATCVPVRRRYETPEVEDEWEMAKEREAQGRSLHPHVGMSVPGVEEEEEEEDGGGGAR